MSFEKELTVAILDQNEAPLGYLDSNRVQVSETNELYNLRLLDIIHPILDEFSNDSDVTRYDNLLIAGNKVWMPQSPTGDSCLYILHADKEYDFDETTITITATEAAIELSQNKVIRLNTTLTPTTSNLTTFLTQYYSELFQVGTLNGPTTTTVTLNGAFTPLEILRKIETSTGGEFKFRYEYESGQINRYIDFYTQIGDTHTTPIELEYNATDINISISEENTRIAASPTGEPSNDASSFHAAMAAFEAIEINKSVQIPLYISKDDAGNQVTGPLAYPPYNKPAGQNYVETDITGELVAAYQRIQFSKNGKTIYNTKVYKEDWGDGKYTGRDSPYRNWVLGYGTPSIIQISGKNYLKHVGPSGSSYPIYYPGMEIADTLTNYIVEFEFQLQTQGTLSNTPYLTLWHLRIASGGNAGQYLRIDTYWNGSAQIIRLSKREGTTDTTVASATWLTSKLNTGTTYNFRIVDNGTNLTVVINGVAVLNNIAYTTALGMAIKGFGAQQDSAGAWGDIYIMPLNTPKIPSQPRIYTFDTTETNLYNLYWACVEKIRSYLQPEVTIDTTVVDIKKLQGATPEQYKTGDTVYVRLPNKTLVVSARITKTVKDPRNPEKDGITISNYQTSLLKNMYKGYYKSAGTIDI